MNLSEWVRDVPDFPKKGILFKDLTTLWKEPRAFKESVDLLVRDFMDKKIDKVIGPESRGFLVGAPAAYLLGAGFVPVRKPGKLPAETIRESYTLEYGEATLEIHSDAVSKGERVLIVDDLLATGGTTEAILKLIRKLGGEVVACSFLVELDFLEGRKRIDVPVSSLIHY